MYNNKKCLKRDGKKISNAPQKIHNNKDTRGRGYMVYNITGLVISVKLTKSPDISRFSRIVATAKLQVYCFTITIYNVFFF